MSEVPGKQEISGMPGVSKESRVSEYSDVPAASWIDEIKLLDIPRMPRKSGVSETQGILGISGELDVTRCTRSIRIF